jgi:glycyl-tRNA synthetase
MDYSEVFPKLIAHCKEHGYIFQSSEIYENGLPAVYDYGPLGVLMKNNLRQLWWRSMVQLQPNIVGLDAAILMHPQVWKASGHVDAFNDPLIDNKDSKKRYRADNLVEDWIAKRWEKARKEADKKAAKEGWAVDDEAYTRFLHNAREGQKAREAEAKLAALLQANDLPGLKGLIEELGIVCEVSGTANWTEVRQFNLMFKTQMGATAEGASDLYLRPETAQGIFVNFLNVQKTSRQKLPFGIAQTGKAFRNEIVARQFIFRMREFEQMEMQFFVKPGTQQAHYEYWRAERLAWHQRLGIRPTMLRLHDHDKLAHYADAAVDIEFHFPFGFRELEGIHSRTDFDLSRHQELSGKKLQYFDPEENRNYIPYVVETSVGLDRLFLAHLSQAYMEEEVPTAKGDTEVRTVLRLHPLVAPVQVAILPLVKKDGLPELAHELFNDLRWFMQVDYDDKDAIGRRYRRQDAKGTPFCITIDHDSLQDEAVTLRERDSMQQQRIPISLLRNHLQSALSFKQLMSK